MIISLKSAFSARRRVVLLSNLAQARVNYSPSIQFAHAIPAARQAKLALAMSEAVTVDLRPTLGATLIGCLVNAGLYGLTTFQMFNYYQLSWRVDSWWIKVYVSFIWVLETIHTFLVARFLYRCTIIDFGNYREISVTDIADDTTTAVTGLIVFSVHLFYIRRLWILSGRNLLLVGIVTILAFAHFGLELAVMALTFVFPEFSQFHKITAYYTGSLAVAAADDILIALSLCYLLYTRRTGIRGTDTLVNRIIAYSVMTGALTSIIDIVILTCFVTMPDSLVYLAIYDLLPNLYANSLLAMLNAREALYKMSIVSTAATLPSGTTFALADLRAGADTAGNAPHESSRCGLDAVSSKIAFAHPSTVASGASDTFLGV
ncbi:hypothetical protein OH77DRAFT_1428888 [Trametes cingulata]|nr:hypothetical protein OH77DRAFT_1428888 [Trametes cingulata]